jgi:hypothetical protein
MRYSIIKHLLHKNLIIKINQGKKQNETHIFLTKIAI